jgi:hypothetical protein
VVELQQISTEVLFSVLQAAGMASIAVTPVIFAYDADHSMA